MHSFGRYRESTYAITSSFSDSGRSLNDGIISPAPLFMISRSSSRVAFLPLGNVPFFTPLKPGPIFFSVLSALWQSKHCASKTSLPLSMSPLAELFCAREPPIILKVAPSQINFHRLMPRLHCKEP